MATDQTAIGDRRPCDRCGRDYRYHGLIVCDRCHAEVNAALEAEKGKHRA